MADDLAEGGRDLDPVTRGSKQWYEPADYDFFTKASDGPCVGRSTSGNGDPRFVG